MFGYGESPADGHAEDLDCLDSRDTGNCRCWYLSFHPASLADENNFHRLEPVQPEIIGTGPVFDTVTSAAH